MKIPDNYTVERLLSYTKQEGSCRVWTRAKGTNGYGLISQTINGKTENNQSAHRAMWFLTHGEIPVGMQVCHSCDNPPCINIDHLFIGTNQDNVNDRCAKGRSGGAYPGSAHHNAKLDEQEVAWIRRILATNKLTQESIGKMFGVSRRTIGFIKTGQRWATA